ncbi:hypothetical protein BHE74_00027040 [Ensete ventricosum]|nr:hypothetical protein BHE74_00027040 [Ensete ventricosum]
MQYQQSCPVRDKIMRRYDQELLGAPLWSAGSSTSVNNTTIRRAVDSRGECHGPAEAGLP